MVCVPCFIIPLLLYIWHKFIQPLLLRYWNPWEKKDAQGNVIKAGPEFPFECKGGVCPFVPKNKKEIDGVQADGEETIKQQEELPTNENVAVGATEAAIPAAAGSSDSKKDN